MLRNVFWKAVYDTRLAVSVAVAGMIVNDMC